MDDGHGYRASRDRGQVSAGSRLIADRVAAFYSQAIPRYVKGPLLDLGCGFAPLYGLYRRHATEVVLVDWENTLHPNPHLDFAQDINEPLDRLEDARFQTVILSDVLEHVREPMRLMGEISRVPAAGGHLLMNVPFLYWLHETPNDYYRYTEYSLRYLSESRGLDVTELRVLGGAPDPIADVASKILSGRVSSLAGLLQTATARVTDRKWGAGGDPGGTRWPLDYTLVATRR